jgi:hypothetical protein
MKIRAKMMLPITVSLFVLFTVFIVYLVVDQSNKQNGQLNAKVETMSGVIAMTNAANVWNIESAGMEANLASFMGDREIVGIKLLDPQGNVMSQKAQDGDKGAVITRKVDIMWEGASRSAWRK